MNTALIHPAAGIDLANRFPGNPLLKPGDIRPSAQGLQIECLLNSAAFHFDGRTWLLLRVAERPEQRSGVTSFPVIESGGIRIREFPNDDPRLEIGGVCELEPGADIPRREDIPIRRPHPVVDANSLTSVELHAHRFQSEILDVG